MHYFIGSLMLCLIALFGGVSCLKAQNKADTIAPLRDSYIGTHFYYASSILPKQTVYTQPYPNYFWHIAIPDSTGDKAYTIKHIEEEDLWGHIKRIKLYQRAKEGDLKVDDFIDCCPFEYLYAGDNWSDYYMSWLHPTGIHKAVLEKDRVHPDFDKITLPADYKEAISKEDSARSEVFLLKQNFKGDLVWKATIGSILTNPHFYSTEKLDMRCNEKGDIFVLKSVRIDSKKSRLYLSKINGQSGKFIFSNRPIQNKGGSIVYLMPDNKDGCYLLLNTPNLDNFILQKYDNQGALLWKKTPFSATAGNRQTMHNEILFLFGNNANLWLIQVTDGSNLLPSVNHKKASPLEIVLISPEGKIINRKNYGSFFNRQPFTKEYRYGTYPATELQLLDILQDPNSGKIYLGLSSDYTRTDLVEGKPLNTSPRSFNFLELIFSPNGELIESYHTKK